MAAVRSIRKSARGPREVCERFTNLTGKVFWEAGAAAVQITTSPTPSGDASTPAVVATKNGVSGVCSSGSFDRVLLCDGDPGEFDVRATE